jgi:uncharacterized membrane protein (DUF2068 family)
MARPTGVTVLAILSFIGAGLTVLVALAFMMGGAALSQMTGGGPGAAMFAGLGAIGGVFILCFAVLYVVVGIGLWMLRNWGRLLMMILAGVGLVFGAIGLLTALMHFRMMGLAWNVVVCAVDLLIITYLLKPHVKQAFGA